MPFQYGPRVCLGMRMALNDMEVVLTLLVRRFRFLPTVGNHKPHPSISITLWSENGNLLRVERRQ